MDFFNGYQVDEPRRVEASGQNPSLWEATVAERFSRKYRIMWNQNGGEEASYHPPR